ncbi:Clp protease ClpB [Psychrobacillus psychrodurans]|uniref:Clp protease ClpB n=1 Tax=Psychrobacillus psychrodurans TaxID=126157 RepID=A0A9X3LCC3_9BACI|nr:Clp protease ClpB [Psychrobacillus psychrodurans]MCZ8535310.1 Clp protease ClpB [Psychrobacillus psychrodurans]
MKQSTYLIGIFIFGISIVISSFILFSAFSNSASKVNDSQIVTISLPNLMTKTQLSEYLQLSEQSIDDIIKKDEFEKANLNSYDTYKYIPYLELDKSEKVFKSRDR